MSHGTRLRTRVRFPAPPPRAADGAATDVGCCPLLSYWPQLGRGTMAFKDFCIVVSFPLFLVAGVVQLTTDGVLSRTSVALALFAVGFYALSRMGPIASPTPKGPPPPA